MSLPLPCTPSSARRCGWSRNASSDATLWSATSQTSPPLPPSPPFGPPNATGPSRRNDTQPAPPSPPRTFSWASSTNPLIGPLEATGSRVAGTLGSLPCRRRRYPRPCRIDERAARWAATMAGHRGGERPSGPRRLVGRQRQQAAAAPRAPARTRGRRRWRRWPPQPSAPATGPSTKSPTRGAPASSATATASCTPTAFRRLAGKTQVFVFPDDHQRTRLTHALEVAQVAVVASRVRSGSTSRSPRRSRSATTAATAPAATPARTRSRPYVPGGFDHAIWGADVTLVSLNLCAETLDGIRNHSWSRPAPGTPEGEVVSWADRIAYVCHDFEDAVAGGVVTEDMLPDLVRDRCGASRREQLGAFIYGDDRRRGRDAVASAWSAPPGRGAGRVPSLQLREHLPAPGSRTHAGRRGDQPAAGAGRALRRRNPHLLPERSTLADAGQRPKRCTPPSPTSAG